MKINLKQPMKLFNGEVIKSSDNAELTLGEVLSNIMVADESAGKMKAYVLAEKMYKDKDIDVDASDMGLIKKAVEGTKVYSNLIAGQALKILDGIKE